MTTITVLADFIIYQVNTSIRGLIDHNCLTYGMFQIMFSTQLFFTFLSGRMKTGGAITGFSFFYYICNTREKKEDNRKTNESIATQVLHQRKMSLN